LGALKLDVATYEDVEADKESLKPAMIVVILSSLAAGIADLTRVGFVGGLILMTIVALISWYIWAWLTYFIGTKILPTEETEADLGQLLRTLGFASAPGMIRILGIIPPLRNFVFLIASIWMLAAMVVAVRQALDYKSTGRAIGVCFIGWLVQAFILGLMFAAFSPGVVAAS
jgi:hypothetical protein